MTIPGYKWVANAAFHPLVEHTAALVCRSRYEVVDNYARPNIVGDLVTYDFQTRDILRSLDKPVSSEVLKYNRDGTLLFVRFNSLKTIGVLDVDTLSVIHHIEHDVSNVPPNHFSFCLLYQLFPMLSKDNTHISILRWNSSHNEAERRERVVTLKLPLPLHRVKRLSHFCRECFWNCTKDEEAIETLCLPNLLKKYLTWKC